jgi:hypothetical protein
MTEMAPEAVPLKWRPVTRGEARGGWQADGRDDTYLTSPTAAGGTQLCRWPRGLRTPLDELTMAVATSIGIDSMDTGRQLAAQYEAGLDIDGEPAWVHGRPA